MKKVIDQSLISSLKEYLNYKTQKELEAFHNVTGQLFRYEDKKYNYICYGAPEAGFVYNTDIPNVIKPSISGYVAGVSGMVATDYINGRFIFSGGFPNIPLTGAYSVSEINYYVSSNLESKLLFETKYEQSPVLNPANSYIEPYNFIAPCVFVKPFETENENYAFGGLDWGVWHFRIIAMMANESYLQGVSKVVRDSYQDYFPLLQNFALNQFGDTKDSTWNYSDYMANNEYKAFISESSFKIEEPDIFTAQNPKMYMGIGNIEVRVVRNPRGAEIDLSYDYALTDTDNNFDTDGDSDFILD